MDDKGNIAGGQSGAAPLSDIEAEVLDTLASLAIAGEREPVLMSPPPQEEEEVAAATVPVIKLVAGAVGWQHSAPAAQRASAAVVGLVYDKAMKRHAIQTGNHPEAPARISRIWALLERTGFVERCMRVPARRATDEELLCVHTCVTSRNT